MTNTIQQAIILENLAGNLFMELPSHLSGKYKSIQFMKDDNFVHRRDRTSNDVHVFLELHTRGYFQLRAYTRHMLENPDKVKSGFIFLTGYHKERVELIGGKHSFRQDWYQREADKIASEILSQNKHLF